MPSVGAGPWSSLEDSYRGRLRMALTKAGMNQLLDGWRRDGIRDRIDNFIKNGLAAHFSALASKQVRAIIHADFTAENLLYNPETGSITALLDYDFSTILHPGHEFPRSFYSSGGQLAGRSGDTVRQEEETMALRNAKITGQFPSPLPAPIASQKSLVVDWRIAEAWEHELEKLDVKRPSTMAGIGNMADVDELLTSLLPWRLTNEDFLRMNTDEVQMEALKQIHVIKLTSLLSELEACYLAEKK